IRDFHVTGVQTCALPIYGKQFDKQSLQAGWDELAKAREEHFNGPLKEWDKAYCAVHLGLAEAQGRSEDLEHRYAQHRALNAIFQIGRASCRERVRISGGR